MFSSILIANRGEIALRVIRCCKEMGIKSIAVYSELDRDALHVQAADEAYLLGPGPAAESYLNVEKLLEVIKESGAEAVHPGYGFLAENAPFAELLAGEGIVFIGPPASAIESMGSKTSARELMQAAGVPIVPGTTETVENVELARKIIDEEVGYPVAIKATGGGGGKGFRVALTADELEEAFEGASREGEKFFSDGRVYIERYLPNPRHIEVQILADTQGNTIHLGERDVDEELRAKIGKIGVEAAKAVGYVGAGTVEGMLQDGEYFFLEMNTRVQVEHCVTEMVTGIDIVREGIRAAAGEPLSVTQDQVGMRGHAIECRINAENAAKNFAPAPGKIGRYVEPAGPGVRVDSGVGENGEVTPMYDPMVAKLIVWDVDREHATARMLRALGEYEIEGLTTLIPFHSALLATEQWAKAETCRDLTEDKKWLKSTAPEKPVERIDADGVEQLEQQYTVEVSGRRFEVNVIGPPPSGGAPAAGASAPKPKRGERKSSGASGDTVEAPLQGNMWKVVVKAGDKVEEGQLLCIIEAMKMENEITAHKAGTIAELPITEGAPIGAGDTIARIVSEAPAE
ncbi:MAG: carbamoyl phosphate synthase [Solirubrobacterales bacterium]|nr:carbamoyl phosphate synthase [Solirubrobacterales bacterium]